jgi:hypothetical protein
LERIRKERGNTVANVLSSLNSPGLFNASFVIINAELYLFLANSIASNEGPISCVKYAKLTARKVTSRQESGSGQKAWR